MIVIFVLLNNYDTILTQTLPHVAVSVPGLMQTSPVLYIGVH